MSRDLSQDFYLFGNSNTDIPCWHLSRPSSEELFFCFLGSLMRLEFVSWELGKPCFDRKRCFLFFCLLLRVSICDVF